MKFVSDSRSGGGSGVGGGGGGSDLNCLGEFREFFEGGLARFLEDHGDSARVLGGYPDLVYRVLAQFSLQGGKRHRPFLLLQGYLGAGGDPALAEQVVRAGVSIELMQSYLLVHDDIMDRSDTRRGFPTVHRVLQEELRPREADWEHLGVSLAILAGQVAMGLGALALMEWPEDRERGRALEIYHRVGLDECYGQMMDLLPPLPPVCGCVRCGGGEEGAVGGACAWDEYLVMAEEQVHRVMYHKTTRYTVEGPLHLGAALAGGGERVFEVLSRIARPVGELFQLKDDILGLRGDPRTLGKPVGSDVEEGKVTLPVVLALRGASLPVRERLCRALGARDLDQGEVEEVVALIESTGAIGQAEERCGYLAELACREIRSSGLEAAQQEVLVDYVNRIAVRRF